MGILWHLGPKCPGEKRLGLNVLVRHVKVRNVYERNVRVQMSRLKGPVLNCLGVKCSPASGTKRGRFANRPNRPCKSAKSKLLYESGIALFCEPTISTFMNSD